MASTLLLMPAMVMALTLNGVDATWTGTTGGTNVTLDNGSDPITVHWGVPIETQQSGLGFSPAPTPTSVSLSTDFILGTLIHFNRRIRAGTQAESADLSVIVDLTGGTIIPNPSGPYNFTIFIDETPNFASPCKYGDSQPCGDLITVETFGDESIVLIDGVPHTLTIEGFKPCINNDCTNLGGFSTSFFSDENAENRAVLIARITPPEEGGNPEEVPVPEPTSLVLLGLGLVAAGAGRRLLRK